MSWEATLARQDLVITRAQALKGGMSRHAWAWKLSNGVWQRALPGVAVAHSGGTTERQRAWAAVLHGGKDVLLSGDAVLRLSGLTIKGSTDLDLLVPHSRRVEGADLTLDVTPAVVVHRAEARPGWRREVRGLAMTTPHVAVLQAAAWAGSDRDAEWRVAAAVQRKITAVPRLREVLADMPRLKRRALLREVLDDVELGAHAGSELQFLRFCRQHDLPLPDELQVRVRVGAVHYLDARYRRQKVTVEVDGAHHREVETWEADALRTLRLVAGMPGEQVVRLTPGLMRHDGDEVAAHLRTILA